MNKQENLEVQIWLILKLEGLGFGISGNTGKLHEAWTTSHRLSSRMSEVANPGAWQCIFA